MWQLDNRTPFSAERTWTRGRDGTEMWLVAVRCTFDIKPDGSTKAADTQPPVVAAPEYIDPDQPQSSLKYDTDLVRTKTATDVIVLGHAYAPDEQPVTELDVGFQIGPLIKNLRVSGDRVWQGGAITAPEPFIKMPIIYERAYGGVDPKSRDTEAPQWDVRNPVGTGFSLSEAGADGQRLPNIENPDQLIRRWSDRPVPAGFGPISGHWQPRAGLAGTYDEKWQHERFPLLPEDFDDRYYQCGPADQQFPQFLKGGEPVVLLKLTPSGEMRFQLPRVFLGLETFFFTGERYIHDKTMLHTVIIEPDIPRVSLVWQAALPCHFLVYKLEQTRIVQKQLVRLGNGEGLLVEMDA
jgi:hypothetical protein